MGGLHRVQLVTFLFLAMEDVFSPQGVFHVGLPLCFYPYEEKFLSLPFIA